jgi:hypothetical protein
MCSARSVSPSMEWIILNRTSGMLMFLLIAGVVIFGATSATAAPSESQKVFDELFGPQIRAARATSNKTDDVEVALTLLDAASESRSEPELLGLLCEAAYQLGASHPDGFAVAAEAMTLWAKFDPRKKADAQAKLLLLRKRQYTMARKLEDRKAAGALLIDQYIQAADTAAESDDLDSAVTFLRNAMQTATLIKSSRKDELAQRYKAALARKQFINEHKALLEKLSANPQDEAAAIRLIDLHVQVTDEPAKAILYTALVKDEHLKQMVELAAQEDNAKLSAKDAGALGTWYLDYASKRGAKNQPAMLQRAYRYFSLVLAQDADANAGGLARTKAKLMIGRIEADAKRLGIKLNSPARLSPRVASRPVTGRPGIKQPQIDRSLPGNSTGTASGASLTAIQGAIASGKLPKPIALYDFDGAYSYHNRVESNAKHHLKHLPENRRYSGQGRGRGNALHVPAEKDFRVTLPPVLTAGKKKFTFGFWIKGKETAKGKEYFHQATLLGVRTPDRGSQDFAITSNGGRIGYWSGLGAGDLVYQSSVQISDDHWHHIALTSDGEKLLLYVDGNVISPKGLSAGKAIGDAPLGIGFINPSTAGHKAFFHNGFYDDLIIFDSALSAGQVLLLAGNAVNPKAIKIEAEAMERLALSGGGKTKVQSMARFAGGKWTKGSQLWWTGTAKGHYLELGFKVPADGKYDLGIVMTKSMDYGIVMFLLDGKQIGSMADLYSPRTVNSSMIDLGTLELKAGLRRLGIRITGANRKAIQKYYVGLDYLQLTPVKR